MPKYAEEMKPQSERNEAAQQSNQNSTASLQPLANTQPITACCDMPPSTATADPAAPPAVPPAAVPSTKPVLQWQLTDVTQWAQTLDNCSNHVVDCLRTEQIDGIVLLALTENDVRDFRYRLNYELTFSDLKRLWLAVHRLQRLEQARLQQENTDDGIVFGDLLMPQAQVTPRITPDSSPRHRILAASTLTCAAAVTGQCNGNTSANTCLCDYKCSRIALESSIVIPNDFFKTAVSIGYSFLVTWITSFVMVIVHERVPDMKRYPPLPDIFLDNVPHIPWAFHMCEITGTLLFTIWACVCIFHKYRMVLLRRFFALAGTVFLLRCVTMLITSLSVPGTHLQCNRDDYAVDDTLLTASEALHLRITRAYTIWSGLGMSIQGVRTCGDYMFSGHTVALTLLNFFITEYTPRNLYFLHTLTWLLNMFGIFFILAAHEHYSIDVFVAFYITSRLFLYYHTLANNQALMQRDSTRTRIWFPMFSYFEDSVQGIIPNEYDSLGTLFRNLLTFMMECKDMCMQTAHRFSIDTPNITSKNLLFVPSSSAAAAKRSKHATTSTSPSIISTPLSEFNTPYASTISVLTGASSGSSSSNDQLDEKKKLN